MKKSIKRTLVILAILVIYAIAIPLLSFLPGFASLAREGAHYRGAYKAASEVRGIDLACQKLLSDLDKPSFYHVFGDAEALRETHGSLQKAWTTIIPELLRHGRDAEVDFPPGFREKLGSSYMEFGSDAWGNPYQFFAGPLTEKNCGTKAAAYYFRTFPRAERPSYTDRNGIEQPDYHYDERAKAEVEAKSGGAPDADGLPGYPAPTDLKVYVWSLGRDGKSCQRVGLDLTAKNVNAGPREDNGNDIYNWDGAHAWQHFYHRTL